MCWTRVRTPASVSSRVSQSPVVCGLGWATGGGTRGGPRDACTARVLWADLLVRACLLDVARGARGVARVRHSSLDRRLAQGHSTRHAREEPRWSAPRQQTRGQARVRRQLTQAATGSLAPPSVALGFARASRALRVLLTLTLLVLALGLALGGLGERLGYSGIKVALPWQTVSGQAYLELYIRSILALQQRAAAARLREAKDERLRATGPVARACGLDRVAVLVCRRLAVSREL